MKFGKLILAGAAMLIGYSSMAQDGEGNRECDRRIFLAGEAFNVQNYKDASMYFLQGEQICGDGFGQKNMNNMVQCLLAVVNAEQDPETKYLYVDSLTSAWDRQEERGWYDQSEDISRAGILLQAKEPNRVKADELFQRGIHKLGSKVNEAYLPFAYYNAYMVYSKLNENDKPAMKKRMIEDYFYFSRLITEGKMSAKVQESLTGYLNYLIKSCDDILPEIPGYIENLPAEKEARTAALTNMLTLLEQKKCDDGSEYETLVDKLVETDPASIEARMMKIKLLIKKKQFSEAIKAFKSLKEIVEDPEEKQNIQYQIAATQLSARQYKAAYGTAMSVKGEKRNAALKIAAQCVAATANNCGNSTFERKCNYIYAQKLWSQAGGGNKYTSNFPTDSEKFDAGSPASVTLVCWNVTVTP
ncbi:MAG: hypothetical protein MK066_02990 [Crocinitomicaceae bacterium]|nr:hypothetical protein [Crocinitomicaceae bacterium]